MANPASYNFGQRDEMDPQAQQRQTAGLSNSEQAIDYEEQGAGERPAIAPENQAPGELDQNAARQRAPRTATTESDRGASASPPPYAPAPQPGELKGQRDDLGIGAPDVPLGLAPVEQARYRALRQIYDAIDAFAASIPGAERYTQRAKDAATRAIEQLQREALGGARR